MSINIAYLVNQYPRVSHSFIRTEILALERLGVTVSRYSIRGWQHDQLDAVDAAEKRKTRYVLQGGMLPLLGATGLATILHPLRFLAAIATIWKLSRGPARGLLYHFIYLAEACLILKWTREAQVRHIHAHFGTNSTIVALLVQALGGPSFSFTVHGPEEFDKPLQLKLREKIGAAAFVVAITAFCRSQLYRFSNVTDWNKIEIVHCGIDARFEATPESAPLSKHKLVCVGRLCEQKGQLVLLEAIAVLKKRGVNVDLVLAGDGEMRPEAESAIVKSGLQDQVEITGWIGPDQVFARLKEARALVLPSFAEGLPVAIMEAMAMRRAVISTNIAGIPELVRNGEDGLLVAASDIEALASAIERILATDDALLAARGMAAAERVRDRHSSDTEARKLAQLFHRVGGA